MKAIVVAMILVAGCHTSAPTQDVRRVCEGACKTLVRLDCKAGRLTPKEAAMDPVPSPQAACADRCEAYERAGFSWNPSCVAGIGSCDAQVACAAGGR